MFSLYLLPVFLLTASLSLINCHMHGGPYPSSRVKRESPVVCGKHEKKYRRSDGMCNNLSFTSFGRAGAPMERLLDARYSDGVSKPRTIARDGSELPWARTVSLICHGPSEARADVSLMVMNWGQFLDHDITITPSAQLPEGIEDCCTSENSECFSILLKNDPYFTDRNCMPFTRSARVVPAGKNFEEQSNDITAFIDASNVYGSDEQLTMSLRGPKGELFATTLAKGSFLPPNENGGCFAKSKDGEYCFLAGDVRVDAQPGLSAMHTIWMREHNRIVRILKQKHIDWDEDTLFEETRRIVAGKMQAITYNEFLPIVLGPTHMFQFSLEDDYYSYNVFNKPDIFNSFATAAYRFGHTLIPEGVTVDSQPLLFKNLFFSPTQTLNNLDGLTKGIYTDLSMAVDKQFSHSITRHLFQRGERTGSDLVACNIQRGRDHGLPPYTAFRRLASQEETTLSELFPNDPDCQKVYKDIEDVDLFTGGLAEPAVPSGLVGPTFAYIIAFQFKKLKHGDRFFYLNPNGDQAFTPDQIEMFSRVKLSKVICDNTEMKRVPLNVFEPTSPEKNPEIECDQIPEFDLDLF